MRILFLLFMTVPIVEMLILIEVGQLIGALPTVGLVLLTAVIGVHLLRQQGVATLLRANQRMQSGDLPAQEMLEGIFLAVGGALLLTPGFFTDTVGFICLLPFTRQALIRRALKQGMFMAGQSAGGAFYQADYRSYRSHDDGVIDGEFSREAPEQKEIESPDSDQPRRSE